MKIRHYKKEERSQLLSLLLELHENWHKLSASQSIRELNAEKNIVRSYEDYLEELEADKSETHRILCAYNEENQMLGFIIGSVVEDDSLVLSKTGVIEDWLVKGSVRHKGIGTALYQQLEHWFREKGCSRVISDTWQWNDISMNSHLKQGFFISGMSFGKIL